MNITSGISTTTTLHSATRRYRLIDDAVKRGASTQEKDDIVAGIKSGKLSREKVVNTHKPEVLSDGIST